MAEQDGSDREDEQSSQSEHDEAETSRPTGSFSMAHALSMIRRRQEDQQRAREEEEERLDKEKKLKAREKRQRRRQNQKLRKAKIQREEAATSHPQIDSNDSHTESVNELRGLKRSDTESAAEGMSGEEEDDEDDDHDDEKQVAGDDSKISRQRPKRFKTNATNELSADQTTHNGAPSEQTKATPTANKLHKQLIPRALLIKRKPPSS